MVDRPRLGEVVPVTDIESAKKAPAQPLPSPESATATERPSSTARLVGVDLARALAVFEYLLNSATQLANRVR